MWAMQEEKKRRERRGKPGEMSPGDQLVELPYGPMASSGLSSSILLPIL